MPALEAAVHEGSPRALGDSSPQNETVRMVDTLCLCGYVLPITRRRRSQTGRTD